MFVKHNFRVFENKALRRIFDPKSKEVTRGRKKAAECD
jgi:hypothetical protein